MEYSSTADVHARVESIAVIGIEVEAVVYLSDLKGLQEDEDPFSPYPLSLACPSLCNSFCPSLLKAQQDLLQDLLDHGGKFPFALSPLYVC